MLPLNTVQIDCESLGTYRGLPPSWPRCRMALGSRLTAGTHHLEANIVPIEPHLQAWQHKDTLFLWNIR